MVGVTHGGWAFRGSTCSLVVVAKYCTSTRVVVVAANVVRLLILVSSSSSRVPVSHALGVASAIGDGRRARLLLRLVRGFPDRAPVELALALLRGDRGLLARERVLAPVGEGEGSEGGSREMQRLYSIVRKREAFEASSRGEDATTRSARGGGGARTESRSREGGVPPRPPRGSSTRSTCGTWTPSDAGTAGAREEVPTGGSARSRLALRSCHATLVQLLSFRGKLKRSDVASFHYSHPRARRRRTLRSKPCKSVQRPTASTTSPRMSRPSCSRTSGRTHDIASGSPR